MAALVRQKTSLFGENFLSKDLSDKPKIVYRRNFSNHHNYDSADGDR